MSNRTKGYRNEHKTKVYLEKQGYQVYTAPFVRFAIERDIWNLFDHVATNHKEILFVQTKSNYCPKPVREAIAKFKLPKNCRKLIFVWKDRVKEPIVLNM